MSYIISNNDLSSNSASSTELLRFNPREQRRHRKRAAEPSIYSKYASDDMFSPQLNKQENEGVESGSGALEWIAYGSSPEKEVGLQEHPGNNKPPAAKAKKPRPAAKAKKQDELSIKQQSVAVPITYEKAHQAQDDAPIAPSSRYSSGVNSTDRSREQYVKIGYPEGETISPKVVVIPPIDLTELGPPYHRLKFGPFYEDNVKEKMVELEEEPLFGPDDCSEISDDAHGPAYNTFSKKSWFKKSRKTSAASTSTLLPISSDDYYWDAIDGGIVSSPKKKLSAHQLRKKKSSKLLLRPKKSKQSLSDTPKPSFFAKLFSKKK